MSEVKVWRYVVPPKKPYGDWGIFLLDSSGMFAVVSDYGNYVYKWNAFGGPEVDFREWFLTRSEGYVEDKLSGGQREYDGDRTAAAVKEHILEHRRDGGWSKEKAREEWEHFDVYSELATEQDFHQWQSGTNISDAWEMASYRTPNQVVQFCKVVLPRLDEIIKQELRNEREKEAAQPKGAVASEAT